MYNRIAGYKQYYKSLVMLGVPIIIGQLGAIITGLADTIMVGVEGSAAIAAVGLTNHHGGTAQYGGTSGGIVRQ